MEEKATLYDEKDLLFYDIEVFKHNSMVCFKDIEGETVRVFSSHLDGLGEYYEKGLITGAGYKSLRDFIEGKTLVGYNNYYYDDKILNAMCLNLPQEIIKQWNDNLIEGGSEVGIEPIKICKTLDCFQQIDVSRPGLKKVEGNMGLSIVESKVDFNIDRALTPSENLETLKYCEYDVLQTIEIFKMRKNYFDSKAQIIEMMDSEYLKEKAYRWNTTSIVGQILKPSRKPPARRYVNDKMLDLVPYEVQEMWRQLDNTVDFKFEKKKVVVKEFGNRIEFGFGGLHGVPVGFVEKENVKLLDVSSMYPSILILMKGLGDKTLYYKDLLEYRLQLKHEGKKEEQEPYKLILNSTYGLLNNKYSAINNPHLAYSICMYGQISLYVLSQRLANIGAEVINVNTDGVAYVYNGDHDKLIKEEWEREFGLNLEWEFFDRWIQTDVNNYIAIDNKGNVTTRGGDVNKYSKNRYFANNDIRIVQKALVDYLLYDIAVQDTIVCNLDNPLLYQYVLQAGGTFEGTVKACGPDEVLDTRVNRVFATKKDGVELLRKRVDGGLVKYPDAPDEMFLWNGDVKDIPNFKEMIDIQWYYDLTMKNLKRWQAV